ncbi:MAG: DUF420 domain-containing protein, partial [Candidatus Sulfotelmatobacter sp.]
ISPALLLAGRYMIARGRMAAHRACMIAAVVASALFLACYVYFHAHVGDILFLGQGVWRTVYFAILIPHVTLAIVIVPMVIVTVSRGLRARYDRHRAIARWTWPLWMH